MINNNLKRAYIGQDTTEVSIRFDHRGSLRGTFDIGRTLIDDRLAIRIAGLRDEQKYKQKPAFTDDTRLYLAWEATLFKNENSNFLGRTSLTRQLRDWRDRQQPAGRDPAYGPIFILVERSRQPGRREPHPLGSRNGLG